MLERIGIAAACLACAVQLPALAGDPPEYYKAAFLAYRDCVNAGADRWASADATPSTIAETVLASCDGEWMTYREAVRQAYTEAVRLRRNRERVRLEADLKAEETRRTMGGLAIQRVLEARLPE